MTWEKIDSSSDRLKVYGGWIVRSKTATGGIHQVFITDLSHSWELRR